MPAVPPVPTKETHPMNGGIPQSKIDFYGLGEIVRKLRNAGNGYLEITALLNEKYVGEDAPKISTMSVHRWCQKNNVDDIDLRKNEETIPNPYGEYCEILDITNEQLGMLRVVQDSAYKQIKSGSDVLKNMKVIKELSGEIDRNLARKQGASTAISVIQEKIYGFVAANEAIRRIFEIAKEIDPEFEAELKDRVRDDVVIKEAYRKIKVE